MVRIFVFFGILLGYLHFGDGAVSVSCSHASIVLVVSFEVPFYGLVSTRPLANCSVQGHGRNAVKLIIPLDSSTRDKCSIVEYNDEYVGIVSVRIHPKLNMKGDTSYLVRCPIRDPQDPHELITTTMESLPMVNANMKIMEEKGADQVVKVGQNYDMKLAIPFHENMKIRIGQCVAFTGIKELKILQLTDNEGCPLSEELVHEFKQEYNVNLSQIPSSINYNAKMKMFNFGDSSHFYLQCQMLKCSQNDPFCGKQVDCNSTKRTNDPQKLLHMNKLFASYTSMRIDVDSSRPKIAQTIPYCQASNEEKTWLSILVVVLSMLSSATWIVAYYNRPEKIPETLKHSYYKTVSKIQSAFKELKYQILKRFHRTSSTDTDSTSSSYRIQTDFHLSKNRRVDFINLDDDINKIIQDAIKPTPPTRTIYSFNNTKAAPRQSEEPREISPLNDGSIAVSLEREMDNLPEPPCISVQEIDELNAAFNNEYETPKKLKKQKEDQEKLQRQAADQENSNNDHREDVKSPEEEELDVKSIDIEEISTKIPVTQTSTLDHPTAKAVVKLMRKDTIDVPVSAKDSKIQGPKYVTDWRNIRAVSSPQLSPHYHDQSTNNEPKEFHLNKLPESTKPTQNTTASKLNLSQEKLQEMLKILRSKPKPLLEEVEPYKGALHYQEKIENSKMMSSVERPRSSNSYYVKNTSVEKDLIA